MIYVGLEEITQTMQSQMEKKVEMTCQLGF